MPLFLRKLYVWGGIFLVLWILNFVVTTMVNGGALASCIIVFIFLGLEIFIAIKGNEYTAKNYLEQGWEFIEPDSEVVKMAKGK